MDTEFYTNPLSYDERIIAERLGLSEYSAPSGFDLNQNIKLELMRRELEKIQEKNTILENKLKIGSTENKRESFIGSGCGCAEGFRPFNRKSQKKEGCTCGGNDSDIYLNDDLSILGNRRVLMIIVFILSAFVIIQYFNHKNEMKDMLDDVRNLLKAQVHNNTAVMPAPTTE